MTRKRTRVQEDDLSLQDRGTSFTSVQRRNAQNAKGNRERRDSSERGSLEKGTERLAKRSKPEDAVVPKKGAKRKKKTARGSGRGKDDTSDQFIPKFFKVKKTAVDASVQILKESKPMERPSRPSKDKAMKNLKAPSPTIDADSEVEELSVPPRLKKRKHKIKTEVPLITDFPGPTQRASAAAWSFSDESSLTGLSDGPESEEEDPVYVFELSDDYQHRAPDIDVQVAGRARDPQSLESVVNGEPLPAPASEKQPSTIAATNINDETFRSSRDPKPESDMEVTLESNVATSLEQHQLVNNQGGDAAVSSELGPEVDDPLPLEPLEPWDSEGCSFAEDLVAVKSDAQLTNQIAQSSEVGIATACPVLAIPERDPEDDQGDSEPEIPLMLGCRKRKRKLADTELGDAHVPFSTNGSKFCVMEAPRQIPEVQQVTLSSTRTGKVRAKKRKDKCRRKLRSCSTAEAETTSKSQENSRDVSIQPEVADPVATFDRTGSEEEMASQVDLLLTECGTAISEVIFADRIRSIGPLKQLAKSHTSSTEHESIKISPPENSEGLSHEKMQRLSPSSPPEGEKAGMTMTKRIRAAKSTKKRKGGPPLRELSPHDCGDVTAISATEAPLIAGLKRIKKVTLRLPPPPVSNNPEVPQKRKKGRPTGRKTTNDTEMLDDEEFLYSLFEDYYFSGVACENWEILDYRFEQAVPCGNGVKGGMVVWELESVSEMDSNINREQTTSVAKSESTLVDLLDTIIDLGKSCANAVETTQLFIAKAQQRSKMPIYKPPLPLSVKPTIWARSRQEVCESFPWFRSYQGGIYFHDGMALGYLLSAFGSANDLFHHNGRLIVSHGGGKSKAVDIHSPDKLRISSDQGETDYGVRSLINCYKSNTRVVLLADDQYRLFPYDLGHHTYVVLGFYRVVYYWAEYEEVANEINRCVKYKFAFQWCEEQGEPWWTVPRVEWMGSSEISGEILSRDNFDDDLIFSSSCRVCHKKSQNVYQEGWTCFNPTCKQFCRRPKSSVSGMTYSSEFLRLRNLKPLVLDEEQWKLTPDPPPTSETNPVITTKEFAKGWWCSKCGKLCCRERWESWYCSNCENIIPIGAKLISYEGLGWEQDDSLSFMNEDVAEGSGIVISTGRWRHGNDTGQRRTYKFPNNHGEVHVISGHSAANVAANELFENYQREAFTYPRGFFRRYPLQLHQLRGTMLTNYFSQNSGAPYKYVGGTNGTVPFEEAPEAVRAALALIKARASAALNKSVDFNEILSAAYLEEQKMSYHSDSEPGLGPTVSSLSLGSIAIMHFRPMKKKGKPNRKVLSLVLRHGDVLVMDGAGIQDYYEHTVIPKNFRIAATARMVGSQNETASAYTRRRTSVPLSRAGTVAPLTNA